MIFVLLVEAGCDALHIALRYFSFVGFEAGYQCVEKI
jgi:hypothetical protein